MHVTPTPAAFTSPTDDERTQLATLLNTVDLRATTPRINVLHFLNIADAPVTAVTVSHCLNLPLSTAYRALTALEVNNLAGVTFGRSEVTRWFRFLPNKPQHCQSCGQSFYTEYA